MGDFAGVLGDIGVLGNLKFELLFGVFRYTSAIGMDIEADGR